ncbi:hypothetical protein QI466_18325, partial [Staphylococcus aureus]
FVFSTEEEAAQLRENKLVTQN